eukprot:TRINITY_DN24482_c0_g1_i1.p1 TRINITY_DN24482_c0_g1~~TRINITY_DN24482_c0_g1_i1.p1  ORF type:complete len:487 (-),score=94.52 TRINITY_DN24482_c0_g1_i1:31-1491(-)
MGEGGSDSEKSAPRPTAVKRRRRDFADARGDVLVVREGRSVVKLFCRELKPNYSMPWTTRRQHSSTSTAFVFSLEEQLLLTNRHCVAHASCIEVRKRGDDQKYEAQVIARGIDCDLALLTVRDAAFWSSGLAEQEICTEVPALFAEVVCVGYPTGGDNLCVTKGVVSRVDYEDDPDPWKNRLVIQIDAAVNPGNSGGPALEAPGGACVGVAYQSLKDGSTENIGFIIPISVVNKFLTSWRRDKNKTVEVKGVDVCAGDGNADRSGVSIDPTAGKMGDTDVDSVVARVTSFGHGRFTVQKLENAGMRRALGMRDGQSGVLVKGIDPTTPNAEVLSVGDVLLALDGVVIGNDGCVPFGCGIAREDRVPFPYLAIDRFVGDSMEARVLHDGNEISCTIRLYADEPLVPSEKEAPWLLDYAVIGGLVFVVLSRQYLRATFGSKWRKERCSGLSELLESKERQFPEEQVSRRGRAQRQAALLRRRRHVSAR